MKEKTVDFLNIIKRKIIKFFNFVRDGKITPLNILVTLLSIILIISILNILMDVLKKMAAMDGLVTVAVITGLGSIAGVILSKFLERSHEQKRYTYERREQAYNGFIDILYKVVMDTKSKEYTEEEMLEDTVSFSKLLTMWGSNEVVKKWLKFRKLSSNGTYNKNAKQMFEDLDSILVEIRKDMGHDTSELQHEHLLGFFINDIDSIQ